MGSYPLAPFQFIRYTNNAIEEISKKVSQRHTMEECEYIWDFLEITKQKYDVTCEKCKKVFGNRGALANHRKFICNLGEGDA